MKLNFKIILTFIIISLIFISCNREEETDRITTRTANVTVASNMVMASIMPSNILVEHITITFENNDKRVIPKNSIEGFSYEPGFEYKLHIEEKEHYYVNPPQDTGNPHYKYTLLKLLSKEKR